MRGLWRFIADNKTWVIAPAVTVVAVAIVLVVLAASGAAPLVYTLF